MDAARQLVAGEHRAARLSLGQEREQILMERAELSAKARGIDNERQLLRREGTLVARERQELEQQRQRQEQKAGELTGARAHIKRMKQKPVKPPEDD